MTEGEWGGRDPPHDDHDHGYREDPEADPTAVGPAGVDVVEIAQQAGGEHQCDVDDDEQQEPDQHEEVQRTRRLDAQHRADPPIPGRQRRGHPQTDDERHRCGDEDRDEVGETAAGCCRRRPPSRLAYPTTGTESAPTLHWGSPTN